MSPVESALPALGEPNPNVMSSAVFWALGVAIAGFITRDKEPRS